VRLRETVAEGREDASGRGVERACTPPGVPDVTVICPVSAKAPFEHGFDTNGSVLDGQVGVSTMFPWNNDAPLCFCIDGEVHIWELSTTVNTPNES